MPWPAPCAACKRSSEQQRASKKESLDNGEGSLESLGEDLVQKWKQEFFPQTVALLEDSDSLMDAVSLTLMAKIFSAEPLHDPSVVDFLRETEEALQ
mmetsp:Transcript_83886/g.116580  ORF Transcript_83886/g.116580 Transcript_83886/m.116580 type:complete len:97 (+) Transcript_83886:112-402(+)